MHEIIQKDKAKVVKHDEARRDDDDSSLIDKREGEMEKAKDLTLPSFPMILRRMKKKAMVFLARHHLGMPMELKKLLRLWQLWMQM